MSEPLPKIISEFYLNDDGKEYLQAFFDEHLRGLQSTTPAIRGYVTRKLADLLAGKGEYEGNGVFPKELLEELTSIAQGTSDLALVIHNLPERDTKDVVGVYGVEYNYSYHIAAALDQITGAGLNSSDLHLSRSSHCSFLDKPVVGGHIHRDLLDRRSDRKRDDPRFSDQQYIDCLALACPINHEQAITQLIHIRKALESIPEETRKTSEVRVHFMKRFETQCTLTLEELLKKLTPNSHAGNDINDIPASIVPEIGSELEKALEKHSYKINLQSGSLLFFSEQQIFHIAHPGDPESIAMIPREQFLSRLLFHHSTGVPVPQR